MVSSIFSTLYSRLPIRVARLARYTIFGVCSVVFDLALLFYLISNLHVHYLVAASFAFIASSVLHYALLRKFLFSGDHIDDLKGGLSFVAISLFGLLLLLTLLAFLVEIAHVHYFWARLFAGIFIGLFSYVMSLRLIFGKKGYCKDTEKML